MAAFFISTVKIFNYCVTPQISSLFKIANTVCNPWARAVRLKTVAEIKIYPDHIKTATP